MRNFKINKRVQKFKNVLVVRWVKNCLKSSCKLVLKKNWIFFIFKVFLFIKIGRKLFEEKKELWINEWFSWWMISEELEIVLMMVFLDEC